MSNDSFVNLPVIDSWDETRTLRALVLDGTQVAAQHQSPGQVIKVKGGPGEGYFALANRPGSGRLELLVRRGATVGDALIMAATRGTEVQGTAPFGRGFPVAEGHDRDVLLFAAGSGISPVRALVQHFVDSRPQVGRIVLFYGERTDHDFAFAHEREQWHAAGVQVVLCCSQPTEEWAGPKGYVQDVARTLALAGIDTTRAVAYLCGMKGMVSAVRDTLQTAGLPVERTHLNY